MARAARDPRASARLRGRLRRARAPPAARGARWQGAMPRGTPARRLSASSATFYAGAVCFAIDMKTLSAFFASWLLWSPAYAHGDHEAKHGGIMSRGDELVSAELVLQKDAIVMYLETEDGHPVPTSAVTGTVTLVAPQRPVKEAKLVPAGDNKLTASGIKP